MASTLVDDVSPRLFTFRIKRQQTFLLGEPLLGIVQTGRQTMALRLQIANEFFSFPVDAIQIEEICELKSGDTDQGERETNESEKKHTGSTTAAGCRARSGNIQRTPNERFS